MRHIDCPYMLINDQRNNIELIFSFQISLCFTLVVKRGPRHKQECGHKSTTVFSVMNFGESSGQAVYDVVNYCQHGYTLENK